MRKRILIKIEEATWLKFKLKAGLNKKDASQYLEELLQQATKNIKIEEEQN